MNRTVSQQREKDSENFCDQKVIIVFSKSYQIFNISFNFLLKNIYRGNQIVIKNIITHVMTTPALTLKMIFS